MIAIIVLVCFLACEASYVSDRVKETHLIPALAEDGCEDLVKISFGKDTKMHLGNILAFTSTLPVPEVTYDVKGKCENVTVSFIGVPTNFFDLDAILGGEYVHWEVHNIPAQVLKRGFHGQAGDELSSYIFPFHPTNDHRYTFFVYCQEEYVNTENEKHMDGILDRANYHTLERSKRFHLGNPVACNFANSGVISGGPDLTDVAPGGGAEI